jgi:hypothetical protein
LKGGEWRVCDYRIEILRPGWFRQRIRLLNVPFYRESSLTKIFECEAETAHLNWYREKIPT